MLVEVGVADAYGACFEGADLNHILSNNDMLKYHDEEIGLVKPGNYTDDTQMMIAIAEAVIDKNFVWNSINLADKFVEVFVRDPRRGYTNFMFLALTNAKTGLDLLDAIGGNSDKSGAAMRVAPIGLKENIDEVKNLATIQAKVTHDSKIGIDSSLAAALMVHYFEYDLGDKKDLSKWLKNQDLDAKTGGWVPGNRIRAYAWDCIESAVCAIERKESLHDILWQIVQWSGDVDTASTIAIAAASRSKEIIQNLPQVLFDGLENGPYGRDYLLYLDGKL